MSDSTTHLLLPYILAAQAQKHVTHNEALRILDGLVQLSVLDRDLTAPPGSPADGDRYIVATGATGDWAGWDLNVALWTDGAWLRLPPRTGWRAWVEDEGLLLIYDGAGWIGATPDALQNMALLGLGTTADASNPFSAKLNAALWTAKTVAEGGTGNLFYTMNKEAAGDDLGLTLQTGFVTKALVGLFGSDRFRLAVSADGSTFFDGLSVNNATLRHPVVGGRRRWEQARVQPCPDQHCAYWKQRPPTNPDATPDGNGKQGQDRNPRPATPGIRMPRPDYSVHGHDPFGAKAV